jgi:uncharacterized protein involved in exopolysaccharide biosynthesis
MVENGHSISYRDPDTFDVRSSLRRIWEATRRHKWLVVFSCIASLALVTVYVRLFPPIYTAEAKLMAEKAIDNNRDNYYAQWDVFRKIDARADVELITAPAILAEVVKKEGLKYDDVYHPFLSHLNYLWKSSWLGRNYTSLKESIFPPVHDALAPSPEDIELARTVSDMKSGIKLTPVIDADIGDLTVKGPSRRVAAIANDLMDIYLLRRSERFQDEAQKNLDALDKEVTLAGREAQDIANRRLAFLRGNHLSFDLSKEAQQLTKIVDVEDGIASNRAKLASLESSLRTVNNQLAQEPLTKMASTVSELNTVREASRMKRLDLETALISARTVYKEDAPEVQDILKNISEVDKLIASEPEKVEKVISTSLNQTRQELISSQNSLMSQVEGVRAGLAVMQQTDDTMRAQMTTVPELQNSLRDFDRQYAMANDKFQALSIKRAQAAVGRAMAAAAAPSMTIVQRAGSPDEPDWPMYKTLYLSALLVGIILGVIGAQLRSLTSGRVQRTDLERGPGESPIYGTIRIPIGTRPFVPAGDEKSYGGNGKKF